jgi:hypothetical protein
VAEAGFGALREKLAAVDDETDPENAIVGFGVVYVRFARERPNLYRVMFGGSPPTPGDRLAGDDQTVFGLFARRLAQVVPEDRRQDAFLGLWSLVHGLASLVVNGRLRAPVAAPEELAMRLGKLLLAGAMRPEP